MYLLAKCLKASRSIWPIDKKFLHVLTRHGEYALNLTQKTEREHLRAQLVAEKLIGLLKRAEVDRCSVATGIAGGQGVAYLVLADIGTIEFVLVPHGAHVGVGKVVLPQDASGIQHSECFSGQCFVGQVLHHEVGFKPIRCAYF